MTNALLPAYVNATDSSGQPAFRYHEVLPVSSEVIACKGSIAEFSPTNHLNRAFCITKRSRRRELGLMIINDQDPNSDSEEQNLTQSLTLKRRGLDMGIWTRWLCDDRQLMGLLSFVSQRLDQCLEMLSYFRPAC